MSTTKERFKSVPRTVRPVVVEGHTFHIRALTLRELDELDAAAEQAEEGPDRGVAYAYGLFAAAVCEADGSKVYTGPSDQDITDVPGDYFRAINKEALKLNGMAKEDDDQGND